MQRIIPHLWYDKEAKEAAEFYVSAFGNDSKITNVSVLHNTPSGSVDIVNFELLGQPFMSISAGPFFKFNPSISFHVICNTPEEVDSLWKKLADGGQVLMELGEYPFSKRYGWLQDKYGLSWQLIFPKGNKEKQRIKPVIMYVGKVCGKAEEAVNFYTTVCNNSPLKGGGESKVHNIFRYGKGQEPDKEGTVMYADFSLLGVRFGAMDSAHQHNFAFNEAISFLVNCDNQAEIDYFWEKLSAVPEAEQCGWLKDKYGVSWQIVPTAMDEMMRTSDQQKLKRVTEAFLTMKKFDLAKLQQAYDGK